MNWLKEKLQLDDSIEVKKIGERKKYDDILNLKPPNEVYNAIYKEVRRKAKEAKQRAIEAYLEVKRINLLNGYPLENIFKLNNKIQINDGAIELVEKMKAL